MRRICLAVSAFCFLCAFSFTLVLTSPESASAYQCRYTCPPQCEGLGDGGKWDKFLFICEVTIHPDSPCYYQGTCQCP